MYQNKKRKPQKGVTLMEVMVALVILTIGLYMTYSTFPLGFSASYRSKNRTIATELAQQKMEDVINNRELIECYHHETNADCRCLPPDVSDTNFLYDNLTYDCRYFYGGKLDSGQVKNSTYCAYHMGTKDDINWKPFPSPNNMWWYHIDVIPVIDPAKKFRSMGDLMKITVSIRGPFIKDTNFTSWDAIVKKAPRGFVEVVFSTLQTNKFLGATSITGIGSNGYVLYVENIRNFTVINKDNLSLEESKDPPKVTMYGKNESYGGYLMMTEQGGNFYNLDNVEIVRNSIYPVSGQTIKIQVSMTNKAVYIDAGTNPPNPETTVKIPGEITLLFPLYYDNNGQETSKYHETIPSKPGTYYGLWWNDSALVSYVNSSLCTDPSLGSPSLITPSNSTYQIRQYMGTRKPAQ